MLFYEGLSLIVEKPDMGIAVILLSLVIRFLLLPLTLGSRATDEEKEQIGREYELLRRRHEGSDPLRYKAEKNKLVASRRKLITSEMANLGIQIFIALMLFRIFAGGLEGRDMHLLYSWTPEPKLPFNLMFLGIIDLSEPSIQLNIITSLLLLVLEIMHVMFSPWEPTINDRLMQIIVPVGVFFYMYSMPAGKKLFVITSLIFSILFIFIMETRDLLRLSKSK